MNAHTTDTQLVVLDLASLRIWKGNPRKTIPDLTDLIASVKRLGVLQPLLVRPLDYPVPAVDVPAMITHEVVAGQCRPATPSSEIKGASK